MEPSTTEASTDTIHSQRTDSGRSSVKRTVRALLIVEAASFFGAALVHAGVLVRGYEHHEAMIAESIIATVLLGGLVVTLARPRSTFSIATAVQSFALLGTLVGAFTIVVGVGPRTVPDIVYHVAIVVALIGGIRVAWRAPGTEAA